MSFCAAKSGSWVNAHVSVRVWHGLWLCCSCRFCVSAEHCFWYAGVQALNRKARYRGIVAGCQALGEDACFPAAGGLTLIAASLQHAIASHAPSKTLQNRCLSSSCSALKAGTIVLSVDTGIASVFNYTKWLRNPAAGLSVAFVHFQGT